MHTQCAVLRTHSVWPLVIVCLVDASELVPSLVVARSLLPLARIPGPLRRLHLLSGGGVLAVSGYYVGRGISVFIQYAWVTLTVDDDLRRRCCILDR